MKQLIYLLSIAIFAVSCNKANKTAENSNTNATLTFEEKEYNIKSSQGKTDETEIDVTIPIAQGESEAAKNINDAIFKTIKSIVGQVDDTSANYDTLFSKFISDYETFIKENTDYTAAWSAEIEGSVVHSDSNIVNIKLDSYTFTGGAHGNSNATSLLFDSKTGKELSIKDIVNDTVALSNIAEKKFREKYNIQPDKAINSTGLMFPDDKFILPQNIFVSKEGLQLYYNPYEIAPYSEGTKDIDISYDEIKDHLKIKF